MANYFCTDSVEEQVDYLTDKVQLLKQADVTINENLQTINTELNTKLTKPATPTAESAVVLGTDGTVGTKPLSEIGGGGREKLYQHYISIMMRDVPAGEGPPLFSVDTTIVTNTSDAITTSNDLWKWFGSSYNLFYASSTYSTEITGFPVVAIVFNNQGNGTCHYLTGNAMVSKTIVEMVANDAVTEV